MLSNATRDQIEFLFVLQSTGDTICQNRGRNVQRQNGWAVVTRDMPGPPFKSDVLLSRVEFRQLL